MEPTPPDAAEGDKRRDTDNPGRAGAGQAALPTRLQVWML